MSEILRIKNLECGYGAKTILRNIDISIKKGELLGIIGPNGSGKTTLIRAISSVMPIKNGSIELDAMPVCKMNRGAIARSMAVVSQTRESMVFSMTVEEAVLLGRIPYFKKYQWIEKSEDLKIVEESMCLTDIIALRERELTSLSGGEKQRVFIARALAQKPRLLLLDEPTTHLDITHQVRVLDLIRKLNKEFGLTVAMVLHDLNLASEYCHKIVLLNKGSVHKIGMPEEVMNFETIEEVYKTLVVVEKSPVSSKPHVFVVTEEDGKER